MGKTNLSFLPDGVILVQFGCYLITLKPSMLVVITTQQNLQIISPSIPHQKLSVAVLYISTFVHLYKHQQQFYDHTLLAVKLLLIQFLLVDMPLLIVIISVEI